jgi:hypothetical protein
MLLCIVPLVHHKLMLQFLNVRQRYKGVKGKYWTLFIEYVRRRDLTSMAVAYPAISPCPIGESLMQGTLSPQEAADLLFYLMNVMSTASAATTTPLTKTTYSFIEEGLDARYGAGTGDALKRYRDSHSPRKSGMQNSTKRKSSNSKRN